MVIQWEGNDLSYDNGEGRLEMDSRAILDLVIYLRSIYLVILTVEDERQMLPRMGPGFLSWFLTWAMIQSIDRI